MYGIIPGHEDCWADLCVVSQHTLLTDFHTFLGPSAHRPADLRPEAVAYLIVKGNLIVIIGAIAI